MSAEIYYLPCEGLDLDPDRVLTNNVGKMSGVVLAGIDKETGEEVFASSLSDKSQVLWLIERLKKVLLDD